MPSEKKVTRKLRAILSADVKGYSLLMSDDEAFTVETLKKYRALMSKRIDYHTGRVVDAPGDNLLAEFESAVDAVECAVDIQKALNERNNDLPVEKRLEFRIGVNIGDVIQDGNNLYGEGVNIAARIEGLAEPGGVSISRNAYDHVKNKLTLGYEYIGEHYVKNIKDPVRIYKLLMADDDAGKLIEEKKKISMLKRVLITFSIILLVTGGIIGSVYWIYFQLPAPVDIDPGKKMKFDLPKGPSIAVLPFDNMTGKPEEDSFCDGFADNLISTLSYTKELLVIARNSSFAYRERQENVKQIGRELNAEWIVEGSVQKAKEKIRITIQLINAESGHHKWSKTYDKEFKDIFRLQDEIAQEVAKAVGVEILWGGVTANAYKGIKSKQEYKLMAEAVNHWNLATPESLYFAKERSLELIEMNPKIPLAYTILSFTYISDIWLDKCSSLAVCIAKAFANLKKALSLNEDFDLAHMVAGDLYLMIGEYDKAINSEKKAITINPSNAYSKLGEIYIFTEELDKAVASIRKAIDLTPSPIFEFYFTLGFAYQTMGDYGNAVDSYNKSLELNPDYWSTYIGLVICYGHTGDSEKAKKAIHNLFRINPDFSASDLIKTMPWKYESSRDFVREGIRKAGLKIEE